MLQHLDALSRRLLPFLTTLILILLSIAATPLPELAAIKPLLGLIAVYYWSVHRPDMLQAPSLFLLGIIFDALASLPLGLSALNFIALAQLIRSQRHIFADQSYVTLWLGFAAIAGLLQALNWIALSLLNWHTMPVTPLLLQTLLTVALFPVVTWLMIMVQRYLVR